MSEIFGNLFSNLSRIPIQYKAKQQLPNYLKIKEPIGGCLVRNLHLIL